MRNFPLKCPFYDFLVAAIKIFDIRKYLDKKTSFFLVPGLLFIFFLKYSKNEHKTKFSSILPQLYSNIIVCDAVFACKSENILTQGHIIK